MRFSFEVLFFSTHILMNAHRRDAKLFVQRRKTQKKHFYMQYLQRIEKNKVNERSYCTLISSTIAIYCK